MPFLESIKIPRERIAVLVGKKGKTKKEIEATTGTRLEIESATGEVFLEHSNKSADFLTAANIVKAIGRGFAPKNAFLLTADAMFLEIVDLTEFARTQKRMFSRRARVIGPEGRIRQRIEDETDTKISGFGKTIAIIGQTEGIETAKKAVEMLLQGAKHATIFKYLHEARFEKGKFEL